MTHGFQTILDEFFIFRLCPTPLFIRIRGPLGQRTTGDYRALRQASGLKLVPLERECSELNFGMRISLVEWRIAVH